MDALLDQVIQLLGAILAAALTALVVQGLRKLGIALDAEKTAKVEYYAHQAALYAEERAKAYAKERLVKMAPAAVLQTAVERLLVKVPNIDRDEAAAIITAALPQIGLGAAAGAAELGKALRTPKGQ
jgi:hypothetical protein